MLSKITVTKAELIRLTKKSAKWQLNRGLDLKKLRELPECTAVKVLKIFRHTPHLKYGDESPVWPAHFRLVLEIRGHCASLDVADHDVQVNLGLNRSL